VLDELRQRRFTWFLLVVGELAELPRVQPKFAGHLHLRVRQVILLTRLNLGLNLGRNSFRRLSHATQPSQYR
jgi:hypothetical protein